MNEGIETAAASQPEIHAALDEIFGVVSDIRGAASEIEGASFRLGRENEPRADDAKDEKLNDNVTGRLEHLRQYLNGIRRDVQDTASALNRLV